MHNSTRVMQCKMNCELEQFNRVQGSRFLGIISRVNITTKTQRESRCLAQCLTIRVQTPLSAVYLQPSPPELSQSCSSAPRWLLNVLVAARDLNSPRVPLDKSVCRTAKMVKTAEQCAHLSYRIASQQSRPGRHKHQASRTVAFWY